jgi:hypothetical protein
MEWILVWTNKQQKGVILDRKCSSLLGAFYPFRCKEKKMTFISEVETRHPIVRHESAQMSITGSPGSRTTRRLGQSFSTETDPSRAKNFSGRPHAPWPTDEPRRNRETTHGNLAASPTTTLYFHTEMLPVLYESHGRPQISQPLPCRRPRHVNRFFITDILLHLWRS